MRELNRGIIALKQPENYLKEVLKEICIYHLSKGHNRHPAQRAK